MQDHGVMMDIYNSLEEILNIEPTVTALGNFDGVHKGHRELIHTGSTGAVRSMFTGHVPVNTR